MDNNMYEINLVECELGSGDVVHGFIGTHKEYNFGHEPEIIGSGSFAVVQKCIRQKKDENENLKEEVACKFLRSDRVNKDSLNGLLNELDAARNINHKNIVKYIDFLLVQPPGYIKFCIIVYELLGANLRDYLETRPHHEYENRHMVHQLLEAVEYLHSRDIMHGDITVENCLLTDTSVKATLKLCDFAFTDKVNYGIIKENLSGPINSMSPEMFYYCIHSKTCDIWSLGVLIYVMFAYEYPFFNEYSTRKRFAECAELLRIGFYMDLKGVSSECSDLVEKMLQVDIKKRINVKDAMDHDWFKKPVEELKPPAKHITHLFEKNEYLKKKFQAKYPDYNREEINAFKGSILNDEPFIENEDDNPCNEHVDDQPHSKEELSSDTSFKNIPIKDSKQLYPKETLVELKISCEIKKAK